MSRREIIPLEDEIRALHQSLEEEKVATSNLFYSSANNESPSSDHHNNKEGSKKRSKTSKGTKNETGESNSKKNRKSKDGCADPFELNNIDAHLEEVAERKNLSVHNVKKILKSIIADEHVVSMLTSDGTELEIPFQPKLTRSKCKELFENVKDPSVSNSRSKVSSSDTRLLIEEELPDDSSDDDEYRPIEEESEPHSDDESFVSSQASDIGSPAPSWAPSTPACINEDSIFKKPLPVENTQDDLIVYRTRSKLPLTDTPLEHLELAFVPPDITTDMYDSDCDDEEWAKFLKEFVCAPVRLPSEAADDEEADPEYNMFEEEEEVDSEELRADKAVRIPKSELENLERDLLWEEMSCDEDESFSVTNPNPKPMKDVLQSAFDEIRQPLSNQPKQPEPEEAIVFSKPTGVVQPLPAPHMLHQPQPEEMILNIQYSADGVNHDFSVVKSTAETYEFYPPEVLFTQDRRLQLEEQLRMHVQLLTQTNMIAAQDRKLTPFVEETSAMLEELTCFDPQYVEIANLNEAIQLKNEWSTIIKSKPRTFGKRSKYNYQRPVEEKNGKKKYIKRCTIHPERCEFDDELIRLMMDSRVFIYPNLLPARAIFENVPAPCQASDHEEMLIALALEQFEPFLAQLGIKKEMIRSKACILISDYLLPHHKPVYLFSRISRLLKISSKRRGNPLQYYRTHQRAPPIARELIPFDRRNMPKLRDIPLTLLPDRWRVYSLRGLHRRSIGQPIESSSPVKPRPNSLGRSIFFLRDQIVAFDPSAEGFEEVTGNSTKMEPEVQFYVDDVPTYSFSAHEEPSGAGISRTSNTLKDDDSPPSNVYESSPAPWRSNRNVSPPPKRKIGRPRKTPDAVPATVPRTRAKRRTAAELLLDSTPAHFFSSSESSKSEDDENYVLLKRKRRESDDFTNESVSTVTKRRRGRPSKASAKKNLTPAPSSASFSETKRRGRPSRLSKDSNASAHNSIVGGSTSVICRRSQRLASGTNPELIGDVEFLSLEKSAKNLRSKVRKVTQSSSDEHNSAVSLEDSDVEDGKGKKPAPLVSYAVMENCSSAQDSNQIRNRVNTYDLMNQNMNANHLQSNESITEVKDYTTRNGEHHESVNNNNLSSDSCSREPFVEPVEVERQPDDINLSLSSSNNVPTVKRFVLLQRDSHGLSCTHVWGPGSLDGNIIHVQTVADTQTNSASESKSASTNEKRNTASSSGATQRVPLPASQTGKQLSASGCGGDDGDDGDKRQDDKTIIDTAEDSECREPMVEDEEEEEESAPLDTLTATPRATQVPPSKGRSPAHRLVKNQRNASRILDSWMADKDSNATDYATAYFEKVTTALKKNPESHSKFITTLERFNPDLSSESILQLYNEISEILEPYPDLLEEFVVFIGPECAASCGKEFEYFLYSQMRNFFFEMKNHLQGNQLKRVLKALQQVENSESHSLNDIKTAILPILKGYSHLTSSFLKLFLDDPPPPSADMDFEEISLEQQSGDEYEFVDLTEGAGAGVGPNQGQGKENEAKSSNRRVVAGSSSKSNVSKGKGKGKALKK